MRAEINEIGDRKTVKKNMIKLRGDFWKRHTEIDKLLARLSKK